jgi:hypothetical protein
MNDNGLDDARATDPVERLLEDSWESRQRRASRRELVVEALAAFLFLAVAGPLAAPSLSAHGLDVPLAAMLVGLYALVFGTVRFPLGAGYVVPSYLMLVPMLLLLPPLTVPLFTAGATMIAAVVRWAARRISFERVLFSIPDAWHALGPALVLALAGRPHGDLDTIAVYAGAFVAGCAVDLATSTLRDSAALGVAPRLELLFVSLLCLIVA